MKNGDTKAARTIVGIDVGGTFTDLIALEPATNRVELAKVPSTPDNQAFGVLNALGRAGLELSKIDLIIHGTTTTTNAVLERKLAKTGLITTAGFRDILELGRRTRPQAYGMTGTFTPVIPRDLRLEVDERVDARGNIITPLDETAVAEAAQRLLDDGCISVLIHFLHAYANPVHEQRARKVVQKIWPNDYITMGHSLLSESREFERGVTAAVNASVQPLLEHYIATLSDELQNDGYRNDILVMNGNGGMVSARHVAKEAAKTVMSGPASGVMAASFTGAAAGYANLITYDMGGTSTDVALIKDATPSVSNEIEIEYAMPIHVPMVDVRTIGAGGGSIARVNQAGLLEVGPMSAGAAPGPICYGRGGQSPTISDANLLLGRLNPASFNAADAGGLRAMIDAAFKNILGDPLGVSAVEAAAAVIKIANTKMAGAIRMVSVSLGVDPRDFALFAFGGAGPLHACALARELSIPKVLIPGRPGITNALGCVVADLRHDFVQTLNQPLDKVDPASLRSIFDTQLAQGEASIARNNIEITEIQSRHSVDMQFAGQTHLLRVDLPGRDTGLDELRALFETAYRKRFRIDLAGFKANLVNVNSSIIGKRPALDLSGLIDPQGRKATLRHAQTGTRSLYLDGGFHMVPVYHRDHLPLDALITGPAIIEQMDTTIVIEPADSAQSDDQGNLVVEIGDEG